MQAEEVTRLLQVDQVVSIRLAEAGQEGRIIRLAAMQPQTQERVAEGRALERVPVAVAAAQAGTSGIFNLPPSPCPTPYRLAETGARLAEPQAVMVDRASS